MEQDTHIPQWTLGDRLRKARDETGLSQDDFGDLILVSGGTVQNYESGATKHPKKLVLEKWAEADDGIANAIFQFQNGKLISKAQYGL